MTFRSILFFAFVFVSIHGDPLFEPCFKDDVQCLGAASQAFLSKTYGGDSKLGILAIDPLIVPNVDINVDENMGLVFHFKNISVTGLKALKISDFKMDLVKKSVFLKMKVDLIVDGDIEVELTKPQKTFNGPYSASTTAFGISEYEIYLKDVNGEQYFELGPETNTCDVVGEPKVTLGSDLTASLANDKDATSLKPEWEIKKVELRKKTLCSIVKHASKTVIHNLRVLATVMPAKSFFKDM